MHLKIMSIISLCFLIIVHSGAIQSAPVGDDINVRQVTRSQSTTTTAPEVVQSTTISVLLEDRGNFIVSEEDLEEILRLSREEVEASVISNPGNYVNEDDLRVHLLRSQQEIERSIKLNPRNYANEDTPIEVIMAMFQEESSSARPVIEDEEICPICKDDWGTEPSFETSCRHKFHRACFEGFSRSVHYNSRCPVCRAQLTRIGF